MDGGSNKKLCLSMLGSNIESRMSALDVGVHVSSISKVPMICCCKLFGHNDLFVQPCSQ